VLGRGKTRTTRFKSRLALAFAQTDEAKAFAFPQCFSTTASVHSVPRFDFIAPFS